jgi:hypothetical protein
MDVVVPDTDENIDAMSTVHPKEIAIHDEASMASELSSVIRVVQNSYVSCVPFRRKDMARLGQVYPQVASFYKPESPVHAGGLDNTMPESQLTRG